MRINIAYPVNRTQTSLEVPEADLTNIYEKKLGAEVPGEDIHPTLKGYRLKLAGGNDLQGFPMKPGVMTDKRVRLLLKDGVSCFRLRKKGQRKKKSVRGCIVNHALSALNVIVIERGADDVKGLTDTEKPRTLLPKRANKIRQFWGVDKKTDPRTLVRARKIEKGEKVRYKKPSIQRLVTPRRLARKARVQKIKQQRFAQSRQMAQEYHTMMADIAKAKAAARSRKRSHSRKASTKA